MQTISIHNTAVAQATNFFTPIGPTNTPSTFRIQVALSVTGVLSVQRTNAATTVAENLNAGTALTANTTYIFDILVYTGDTISLQTTGIGTTILKCIVREIPQ